MMQWRNFSIGRKLMLITALSSAVALLIASVGFFTYDLVAFRKRLGRELMTAAEMIGLNSKAALESDDPGAAAEVLTALRANPQIETAAIYTPQGKVFARYLRPGADPSFLGEDLPVDRNHLEVVHGIVVKGQMIGTLYVRSDVREWYGRLKSYVIIGGGLMLGWGLLALLLLLGLQREITGPVLELAGAMRTVSVEKNYSLRATKANQDEIGALIDGFNGMLSEIQQRDAALLNRTAELEAANQELEAFTYSVSHDLRAPLRAIDGYSRMLTEDYDERLDDEGRRVLGVVRRETQRMGQLIDDLLAFSRLGRQEMAYADLNMSALTRDIFAELSAQSPGRVAQLQIGDLPHARGDPAMVRQALVNLLANAIKFTRPRPVAEIVVMGAAVNGECQYTIRDNGVGFDMNYVHKLFGVFQRLHVEQEFEGTGVGLALVQRIVHRHGGRIWAEAKVNQGATFSFTLPEGGGQ